MKTREFYYLLKPLIPRRLQIALRSRMVVNKRQRFADEWPILESAAGTTEEWRCWPRKKIIRHSPDPRRGHGPGPSTLPAVGSSRDRNWDFDPPSISCPSATRWTRSYGGS